AGGVDSAQAEDVIAFQRRVVELHRRDGGDGRAGDAVVGLQDRRDGHAGRTGNNQRSGIQSGTVDGTHRRVAAGQIVHLPGDRGVAAVGDRRGELLGRTLLHVSRGRRNRDARIVVISSTTTATSSQSGDQE